MTSPVAGERALDGLRVIEFTAGMAGPWIGRFLAWAGAEVIKVESKSHPDVTRLYVPPRGPGLGLQPELSPWFTDWNAGKRFVSLDLTRPPAIELCKSLVARADVVVENYSTGVLAKLGLGYDVLRGVRPDLVMISSTGYGDSGPCARYVTWGPNIEALSGLAAASGFPARGCTVTQYAYPDPLSAVHGLFAVLCALDYRRCSGRGQHVAMAQYEATVAALGPLVMECIAGGREPVRRGNRLEHCAPQGCYPCRGEDRWCAITVFDDADWQALCDAVGHPEWARDARFRTAAERLIHHDTIDELLAAWTADRDAYEVMSVLQDSGVAAGVVQTADDLLRHDRHLRERGFFEQVEHFKKNESVTTTGVPLGLTGTPGRTDSTGKSIGYDTDYVFGEVLGMSADAIEALVADGVIELARGS